MDIEKLKRAKISPVRPLSRSALTLCHQEELKKMPPKLRRFYKRHNRLLENFEKTESVRMHIAVPRC